MTMHRWKAWGLLKNELVRHRRFKTRAEAIQAITEYIEIFYKRQGIRAQLSYLSPAAFEHQFYEKKTDSMNQFVFIIDNRPRVVH